MPKLFFFLFFIQTAWSVPCTISLVKASCWKDYDVKVDVTDLGSDKKIASVSAPKGMMYGRINFDCQPKQGLSQTATFSPIIWDADKGKSYHAIRLWYMPESEPSVGNRWEIKVCFPKHFSNVPLPQGDVSYCGCDFNVLPSLDAVPIKK